MENSRYNGKFDNSISITIKADNHDTCLQFTNHLKKVISAWFFQITHSTENKSSRKGDVLRRDIWYRQEAYASDIIIFNEMLKSLVWHYNLRYNVEIVLTTKTIPVDTNTNFI